MIRKYLATASPNSYGIRPCNVREFLDWGLSAPRTKPTGNPMGQGLKASNNLTTESTKGAHSSLGRWNIDYCYKKINNKIDLSNEDHCGPCGQYALTKNDELRIKSNIEKR